MYFELSFWIFTLNYLLKLFKKNSIFWKIVEIWEKRFFDEILAFKWHTLWYRDSIGCFITLLYRNCEDYKFDVNNLFFFSKNWRKNEEIGFEIFRKMKNSPFARDLCMLNWPKLKLCIHTILVLHELIIFSLRI